MFELILYEQVKKFKISPDFHEVFFIEDKKFGVVGFIVEDRINLYFHQITYHEKLSRV